MSAAATPPPGSRALPSLTLSDCDACDGEGYRLAYTGTPQETYLVCVTCGGEGKIEVCEGCGEVPYIGCGLELCGCTAEGAALGWAAGKASRRSRPVRAHPQRAA